MRSAYMRAIFPVCKHKPTSFFIEVTVIFEPFATATSPDQPEDFRFASIASRILVALPFAGLISTLLIPSAISIWIEVEIDLSPAQWL